MTEVRVGRDLKANLEVQEVDSPVEEDSRRESSIRFLPPRDPEYWVKLRTKIMQTSLFCITCCLPFSCLPRCALVWGMVVRGFARRDLC